MNKLFKPLRRSWAASRADAELIAYVVAGITAGQGIAWAIYAVLVWL